MKSRKAKTGLVSEKKGNAADAFILSDQDKPGRLSEVEERHLSNTADRNAERSRTKRNNKSSRERSRGRFFMPEKRALRRVLRAAEITKNEQKKIRARKPGIL